ncbi:hypothetical protein ACFOPQ_05185 [Deinococcus antarcticus]|uniref:Uncharacterized protein n=1 Tax=Deinococcus antarcticus TaxID=1298767 RepID=A0ABV8A6P6_9DEIO
MVKMNRLWVTILALGALSVNLAAAQFASSTVPSTSEQELFKRALSFDSQTQVELLLGKAPKDFPVPVFAGSRLIGTVMTTDNSKSGSGMNRLPDARVFLDVPGSLGQTSQALNAFFKKQGYQLMAMPGAYDRMTGGFQTTTPTLAWGQWYRQKPADVISYGLQQVGAVTQVSLMREALTPEALQSRLRMAALQGEPTARLPKLVGPADSRVMGQGSGSSGEDAYQSAAIESTLALAALHDHFARQLTQAGWKLIQKGGTSRILVSLWQAPNQSLGELTLSQSGQGRYRGMIRISGM